MEVELYGVLREAVGDTAVTLDLEPPLAIAEVLDALTAAYPALEPHLPRVACAVADTMRSRTDQIQPGETLVLLPPVSGG